MDVRGECRSEKYREAPYQETSLSAIVVVIHTSNLVLITFYLFLISYFLFLISYFLLLITYYLLLGTYYLLLGTFYLSHLTETIGQFTIAASIAMSGAAIAVVKLLTVPKLVLL